MCAAPGSKTAQLIEFLHADDGKVPSEYYNYRKEASVSVNVY